MICVKGSRKFIKKILLDYCIDSSEQIWFVDSLGVFDPHYIVRNCSNGRELLQRVKVCRTFTEEQLKTIPVDNKVGENYFGHLFQQLKNKGGYAFQAISDRLVLKTSSYLALGNEGANMLKDKELMPTERSS